MSFDIPRREYGHEFSNFDKFLNDEYYALITDYAFIRGVSPFYYLRTAKMFGSYWFSETQTVRYSVYDGGGEETYQCIDGVVNYTGLNPKYSTKYRDIGIRPSIDYNFIISNGTLVKRYNQKYCIYQYGEYPQSVASMEETKILESLYKNKKLIKRNNKYSYVEKETASGLIYNSEDVYEYNGCKYVRTMIKDSKHSALSKYKDIICQNKYIWVKVEPINWIVNNEKKMALSEKIIIGGVKYNHIPQNETYGTLAEHYLRNYFSKEIECKYFGIQNIITNSYDEKDINQLTDRDKYTLVSLLVIFDEFYHDVIIKFVNILGDEYVELYNSMCNANIQMKMKR